MTGGRTGRSQWRGRCRALKMVPRKPCQPRNPKHLLMPMLQLSLPLWRLLSKVRMSCCPFLDYYIIFWSISPEKLRPISWPSDVGGSCPAGTNLYAEAHVEYCCCGDGCCWDRCTWQDRPEENCLPPGAVWRQDDNSGHFLAMLKGEQLINTLQLYRDPLKSWYVVWWNLFLLAKQGQEQISPRLEAISVEGPMQ